MRLRRWMAGIAAFFILLQIFFLATHLPIFNIKEIEIVGNAYLSQEDLMRKIESPLGQSIWKVSEKKLLHGLRNMAEIQEARIKKRFPSKLQIIVLEYQPLFRMEYEKQYLIFSSEGKILNSEYFNPKTLSYLPEIKGLMRTQESEAFLKEFKLLLEELPTFARKESVVIDIHDPIDIQMLWKPKLIIHLGESDFLSEKIRVLKALYPMIEEKRDQIREINLTAPSHAAIAFH